MPSWTRSGLALLAWVALGAAAAGDWADPVIVSALALPAAFTAGWGFRWSGAAIGAFGAWTALRVAGVDPAAVLAAPDVTARLLEPLALGVLGAGGAWIAQLQSQLRAQRAATVRAQFDPLTGLLNRTAFEARVHTVMSDMTARNDGGLLALFFIDLDRFKSVNDTYGHEVGDKLLRRVARMVRDNVREHDLVARLGGDEFTLAVRGLREHDSARAIARKLLEVLNEPHVIDGRTLQVGASIGIAFHPRDGATVDELLKNADHAMYHVKEGGKNGVHLSTLETQRVNDRRLQLEKRLRIALEEDEFELHYQPKVDLRTGAPVGVEMLLRWKNDELGSVSPEEFIPLAEETGMILQLGRWVMRQACHQLRDWDREGLPPVHLSVNVSTLQFRQPDFVNAVEEALDASGLNPERLEVEMTESVLVRELEPALRTLERLRRRGVRTALDDFGTGYSSLAYLQRLPVGTLKIDREFIAGLSLPTAGAAGGTAPIVEAIVVLAQKLGMAVVAEGIERPEQASWLASIGCHYGQGFLYAKPLPAAGVAHLLRKARPQRLPIDVEGDRLLVWE